MVRVVVAALLGILLTGAASAQTENRLWHGTFYASRWLNTDLTDLPTNAFKGNLSLRDTYFAGAALTGVIVPDFTIPVIGTDGILGNSLEVEAQIVRHFGQQEHTEGTLALLYRTPNIGLPGGFAANFAFGEGMSYAFTDPTVEGLGKVRPHRLLNFLVFETELSHSSLPGWHLVPRLHHRSGIWGLIAPKYAGSNYVGLGVRYDFR